MQSGLNKLRVLDPLDPYSAAHARSEGEGNPVFLRKYRGEKFQKLHEINDFWKKFSPQMQKYGFLAYPVIEKLQIENVIYELLLPPFFVL